MEERRMSSMTRLVAMCAAAVLLWCGAAWGDTAAEADVGAAQAKSGEGDVTRGEAADAGAEVAEQPAVPAAGEGVQLAGEKLAWYNRIRALAYGEMLKTPTATYRKAEGKLLEITDPKALEPMALVMYNENTRWRSSFLKATEQYGRGADAFASHLAVSYLSDMAVLDPSAVLRGKARAALMNPTTPRHPDRLRHQVANGTEPVVRSRAAGLLADLKDRSMLGPMVDMLTTEEWRLVGKTVETRSVQMDLRMQVAHPPDMTNQTVVTAAVPGGIATATITLPRVQATSVHTTVSAPAGYSVDYDWEKVTVRHPGMLKALKRLTGKNFGYNKSAWAQWLRSQRADGGSESRGTGTRSRSGSYDVQWD